MAQPANQPELQQPASRSAAIRLLATLGLAEDPASATQTPATIQAHSNLSKQDQTKLSVSIKKYQRLEKRNEKGMNDFLVKFRAHCNFIALVKGASRRLNSQFIKAPQSGADYHQCDQGGSHAFVNQFSPTASNWHRCTTPARPNRALNRTLHSLPPFGLQKPSPNTVSLFRAG